MAVNSPVEIVESYQGLLIMQYLNLPKASATIGFLAGQAIISQTNVQQIDFSGVCTSGAFVLSYNGNSTATINWNDSAATIQTKLQAIPGLSAVTVAGSIANQVLTVTFTNVIAPAFMLDVASTSLMAGAVVVTVTIVETDITLPLAVQNGFNLIGDQIAQGVQLDVIGQYCGVTRYAQGFTMPITLNDADFYTLIKMAIIKNNAGSSLYTIENLLAQFFPGQISVLDTKQMSLIYVIPQTVGSGDLIQVFVTEGVLPSPMAVAVGVINPPSANLFVFRTYEAAAGGAPFNSYDSYSLTAPWLSYSNKI